jgi:hypothetical protein
MSGNIINIEAGQKYGRWTVAATGLRNGGKRASWCICECGNEVAVNNASLSSGKSLSCGCLRAEKLRWRTTTNPRKAKQVDRSRTMSQPVERQHTGPRLIELTDTRHNANDGIGSGVRLPQGISSAAQI